MAGLINECELRKNSFNEKTLDLAPAFGICSQRNVQYEKIFLHEVSGEVPMFPELRRYFQTPKNEI